MTNGISCILSSVQKNGIRSISGNANKTFNFRQTQNGQKFIEVISDFGEGLKCRSEVFPTKIINYGASGDVYIYERTADNTVVKEGNKPKELKGYNVFNRIRELVLKGI